MTVDRGRRARPTRSRTRRRSSRRRPRRRARRSRRRDRLRVRRRARGSACTTEHGGVHVLCNNAGVGLGRRGLHLGARARRLAVGLRRQRVGRHPRHQGVRAADGRDAANRVTSSTRRRATAASSRSATPRSTRRRRPRSSRSPSRCTRTCCAPSPAVRASVLFPGPNWLRTNLWEAWRWRPDEYAKTVPRQTPYPSLDQLEQIMAERGVELEWTPLEEVADVVVRGIRAEQFWMLPPSDDDRRVDPRRAPRPCSSAGTPTTSVSGRT